MLAHMQSTVAYLGPAGTFTEAAVLKFAARGAFPGTAGAADTAPETLPLGSPTEVLDAVRAGRAAFGVIAIENSVDGPVTQAFDALAAGEVQIYDELDLDIAFTVMARPGTALADVRRLASHPVGYQQVRGWLAAHAPGVEFVPGASNGAAARMVAEGEVDAAAAPARAADLFGLDRLAEGIADVKGASTRFVLVGPPGRPPARTGRDRTSVAFRLPNTPGTLVGALGEFAQRGVNLTRIASRPTRELMGTYVFYADMAGHIDDAPVGEALRALWLRAEHIAFLGSWPDRTDPGREAAAGGPDLGRIAAATRWVDALRAGEAVTDTTAGGAPSDAATDDAATDDAATDATDEEKK